MANQSFKWLIGYYFKRYVLNQPVQQVLGERYEEYARWKEAQNRSRQLPNIAVAKPNREKYTETFIRKRIESLEHAGYYVHNLFGGYLPTADYHRGLLLFDSLPAIKFLEWITAAFNLKADYFDRKILKWYFQKNKVQLVVVEFGTTAAEVYPICVSCNIPFIVTFHGYDAWHPEVVNRNRERYREMFKHAAEVIGVSKGICNRLEELGCPAGKLHYLPAPVSLEKITCKDHSQSPNVFLTVGRFAELKSPHLTILAFNEVLKVIPDARMVMVGKDGGGELFEACHILARALNIQDRIDFKGILSHHEVLNEMQNARVFVQHSLTTPLAGDKEGTPVAIMEAMACGLPVISTKHSGISEIVTDKEYGLLVDEYDYMGMARAMIEICKSDELVSTYGRAASGAIRNNKAINENESIFMSLVNKHIR